MWDGRGRRSLLGVPVVLVSVALAILLSGGIGVATATSSWTQVTGQSSFAGTTLSGLSCPTSTHCVAGGFDTTGAAIRVGDSGTWSAQTPGATGQSTGSLNGVSCISSTNCVAVGEYTTGCSTGLCIFHSLMEMWDGTSWTAVNGPAPGDTYNFLFSVSCVAGNAVTPNECVAVGYWESTSGSNTGQRTLVVEGTQPVAGGSWTWQQVTSPNPGMTNNSVNGVACPSLGTCIAVGHAETFFQNAGNFSGALALKVNESGGTWTATTLSTDNTGDALAGVACVTPTSCLAVGSSGSPSQAAAERWDGSPNGFAAIPNPIQPGSSSSLASIACVSGANCTAVGSDSATASSPTVPLVEQYDGANWTLVNAPSSGAGNASLRNVACDGPTNTCTAVGTDSGNALVLTGSGFVAPATATTSTTTTATSPPLSPPAATTGAPAVHGTRSAGLSAVINPHGLFTGVRFEYGTDTTYGLTTPVQSVGADFANHVVSETVSGLLPNVRYHVRAVASNSAGSAVGSDQTFRTGRDPLPSAPVLGKTVNAVPIRGQVFVKPPPGALLAASGAPGRAAQLLVPPHLLPPRLKGQGFIPLTEARQIPVGSTLDTISGTVRLTTATASRKQQVGDFSAGIFTIRQTRRQRGLTKLNLIDAVTSGQVCTRAGKASIARSRLSSKVIGLLTSSAHGRFTTRGRYSAATVRGTKWSVANRCDGTLTRVTRGVVIVRDFRQHKNITVRAGRSYLARAPGA